MPMDPNNGRATKQLKMLQKLAKNQKETENVDPILTNCVNNENKFKLDWTDLNVSKEEVFLGYINFLRSLPEFITSEREKIIKTVRTKLKIDEIELNLTSLRFDKLVNTREGSHIVDLLSAKLGQSLR